MISIINAPKNIYSLGYVTTKKEKFTLNKDENLDPENDIIEENKSYYTPQELFEIEKAKERTTNNLKNYYNSKYDNYDIYNKDYEYSIYGSKEIISGAYYDFGVFLDIQEVEKIMPLEEFEKLVTIYIDIFKQDDWLGGSYTNDFIVGMAEYQALAEITGNAFRTDQAVFLYDEEHGWEYLDGKKGGYISDIAPNLQGVLSDIAKYISENYVKNLTFDYWGTFLDDLDKMYDHSNLKKAFNDFNKVFKD